MGNDETDIEARAADGAGAAGRDGRDDDGDRDRRTVHSVDTLPLYTPSNINSSAAGEGQGEAHGVGLDHGDGGEAGEDVKPPAYTFSAAAGMGIGDRLGDVIEEEGRGEGHTEGEGEGHGERYGEMHGETYAEGHAEGRVPGVRYPDAVFVGGLRGEDGMM